MTDTPYKIILISLIETLKEQGMEKAGKVEGLDAYAALLDVMNQAEAYEVPLEDIRLGDFDLDDLLKEKAV